jgi:hypothetical protein
MQGAFKRHCYAVLHIAGSLLIQSLLAVEYLDIELQEQLLTVA